MPRGHTSRIFHEPCTDDRQRDIFPLPVLRNVEAVQSFVCRAVKKRIHRRQQVTSRVNMAMRSLNSLFFGGDWSNEVVVDDLQSLPLAQRLCIRDLIKKVSAFGSCPTGASSSEALKALRVAGNGYEEPLAGVGAVVDMKLDRLSLPTSSVAGVVLEDALDGPLQKLVVDFEDWMLQDAGTWSRVCEDAYKIKPYNDPSLNDKHEYISFLKVMRSSGILGFTNHCRGRVGTFCVSKKSKFIEGREIHRQRLILDCRQVNMAFREPPRCELGSLSALCGLELEEGETMYCGGSDIQDCFYAAQISQDLANFFCLFQDVHVHEAADIWGDDFPYADYTGMLSPCVTVLPMGFSWSFYIIQKLHEQSALRSLGTDRSSLILEGYPAPELSSQNACAMPYCDNVHSIALSREACDAGLDQMQQDLSGMGFSLHEEARASEIFQTLGGLVDGQQGIVRLTPTRTWNILLAFESLLHGKVHWEDVRRLLGHAVTICVLNRCGMSIFRSLYDMVEARPNPRKLKPREIREVKIFVGLIPLLYGDLRKSWCEHVLCTDASPFGYGVCQRDLEVQHVKQIGQWQDKWRFRHLDPSEWRPRQRSQGPSVLTDWRSVLGELEPQDIEDLYAYNEYFPEVPTDWTDAEHWSTQMMGRWHDTSSHITEKEGHALVLAVRHLSRASSNRGKKHLVLVDNFSLSMAMCKGRACSFGLLRTTQKIAALSLACDFSIHTRWISSERNVADGPSRGVIQPGALPSCSSETFQQATDDHSVSPQANFGFLNGNHENDESWIRWFECAGEQKGPSVKEANYATSRNSTSSSWQEAASDLQEDHCDEGSRAVGSQESLEPLGEEIDIHSSGEPVCRLLSEVRQFLPGGRGTTASARIRRRHFDRLSGPPLPGGQRCSRGREDHRQPGVPTHSAQGKVGKGKKGASRLEERTSTRITNPYAKTHSVRSEHADAGQEPAGYGFKSSVGLRHLHAPRRVIGPSKKTLCQASEAGGPTVPLVLHHCQRLRRPTARQSGSLRQFDSSRQQRKDVAGRDSQSPRSAVEGQRASDLSFHHGSVPKGVHEGSKATADEWTPSLSTAPRRSSRRSLQQAKRSPRSQTTWKMGHRSECETLHQSGKSSAVAEPIAQRSFGVLSMVSPQHGESSAGPVASQELLRSERNVFDEASLPRVFGLEIFAGTARICTCFNDLDMPMYPIDICLFSDHNVLDKAVEHRIFNWIRSGRIGFIWCGMPCTSFSRARKWDGLGPGPIRSPDFLWGLPDLNGSDRRKVLTGNNLLLFTLRLLRLCERCHVPYALENPMSSMAWDIDKMQYFISSFSPQIVLLDYCQFGEIWKKPTKLLTHGWDSSPLHVRCQGVHGRCSKTSRPHVPLRGRDYSGLFMTLRAQPYPWAMAQAVADQMKSLWPKT